MPLDPKTAAQLALMRDFKAARPLPFARAFGAHAWGIGYKRVQGKKTGELALRFYVESKIPPSHLPGLQAVPPEFVVTSRRTGQVARLPTDIIVTPRMRFEVDPETKIRPIPGGVSAGINGSTGTLGGWCWDTTDDTIVGLSNEHVFGSTAGVAAIQQGSADGGTVSGNRFGETKRGIPRSTTAVNQVDCAIAEPDDVADVDMEVLEIGAGIYTIDNASDGMTVEKYGQTTHHTYGEIDDVDYSGDINGDGNVYEFEDCLYIVPLSPSSDWSNGGDSGSAVFSQTPGSDGYKPVVGLHFAGGGANGVACKIENVFNRLRLTTLCAGMLGAFLDDLFAAESEADRERWPRGRLPHGLPRLPRRSLHAGKARELQKRLQSSPAGQRIVDFVNRHRAPIVELLAHDPDVRSAAVQALQPLLGGATTTEVLERPLDAAQLARFDRLAAVVADKAAHRHLALKLDPLQQLRAAADGKSLKALLGVR